MSYSKRELKNRFYIDLNVIYPFFDYLAPKSVFENKKDLEKRKESIINFITENPECKFVISRSVYMEWFQRSIEDNWDKSKHTFNQFRKTNEYKQINDKFEKTHSRIVGGNSRFEFEWEFNEYIRPTNQTWDHFHVAMRQHSLGLITFDRKLSKSNESFIFLKK